MRKKEQVNRNPYLLKSSDDAKVGYTDKIYSGDETRLPEVKNAVVLRPSPKPRVPEHSVESFGGALLNRSEYDLAAIANVFQKMSSERHDFDDLLERNGGKFAEALKRLKPKKTQKVQGLLPNMEKIIQSLNADYKPYKENNPHLSFLAEGLADSPYYLVGGELLGASKAVKPIWKLVSNLSRQIFADVTVSTILNRLKSLNKENNPDYSYLVDSFVNAPLSYLLESTIGSSNADNPIRRRSSNSIRKIIANTIVSNLLYDGNNNDNVKNTAGTDMHSYSSKSRIGAPKANNTTFIDGLTFDQKRKAVIDLLIKFRKGELPGNAALNQAGGDLTKEYTGAKAVNDHRNTHKLGDFNAKQKMNVIPKGKSAY